MGDPTVTLEHLLQGLTQTLQAHISAENGLYDPIDDAPSPADHYGHLSAALALACAGENFWPTGRLALQAWLNLPPQRLGHLPFNRLMLLLLREVLAGTELANSDVELIRAALQRCTLQARYPSNNWSLLAQTCRLIEAPASKKEKETRKFVDLVERWTTPKGAFIDFPEKPEKQISTPLAYHHKALFLVALACHFHEDEELLQHARRLCDWLVHCWDPAGYAGGFGRSTHSLFGDGCLIAALILLGIDEQNSQPVSALAHRIASQRRDDGFLWLNPAGHESGTASWDSYMHLSVYNAWAAGVIHVAIQLRQSKKTNRPNLLWTASRCGWFHDEVAGLGCLRTSSGTTALISTYGQPPQGFSRDEVDFRYAGGLIVHLHHRDHGLLAWPPIRVQRKALLEQPQFAGWTPLFSSGNRLFGLTDFEQIAIAQTADQVQITLQGCPTALVRSEPSSAWEKLRAAVDWRFFGGKFGRKAVLRRRTHSALNAKLILFIDSSSDKPKAGRMLEYEHEATTETCYLNPQASAWKFARSALSGNEEHSMPFPASLPGAGSSCLPPEALPAGNTVPIWNVENTFLPGKDCNTQALKLRPD